MHTYAVRLFVVAQEGAVKSAQFLGLGLASVASYKHTYSSSTRGHCVLSHHADAVNRRQLSAFRRIAAAGDADVDRRLGEIHASDARCFGNHPINKTGGFAGIAHKARHPRGTSFRHMRQRPDRAAGWHGCWITITAAVTSWTRSGSSPTFPTFSCSWASIPLPGCAQAARMRASAMTEQALR